MSRYLRLTKPTKPGRIVRVGPSPKGGLTQIDHATGRALPVPNGHATPPRTDSTPAAGSDLERVAA